MMRVSEAVRRDVVRRKGGLMTQDLGFRTEVSTRDEDW